MHWCFFWAPFAEPSAEGGEVGPERAREGIPRVRRRDRDGPSADPLRRRGAQGTRCILRAMAQAQMALGTLAETKVPRLPGRDPANIFRRSGDKRTLSPPVGRSRRDAPGASRSTLTVLLPLLAKGVENLGRLGNVFFCQIEMRCEAQIAAWRRDDNALPLQGTDYGNRITSGLHSENSRAMLPWE